MNAFPSKLKKIKHHHFRKGVHKIQTFLVNSALRPQKNAVYLYSIYTRILAVTFSNFLERHAYKPFAEEVTLRILKGI